jgi:hypothetical protein
VCGKPFKGKGITCSLECSTIRKQQVAKKYREEHKEKIAKYQKAKSKERYMTSFEIKKQPKPKAEDPEWIVKYLKADRLTQISMLAVALTDLGTLMNYGKLSSMWDTDEYRAFEKQVFREKRKQYANINTSKKNSIKSKDRFKNI